MLPIIIKTLVILLQKENMTKTTVDHCIFLGSPGVGKSTYAYKLAHERGMVYLSVSQMLRASVDKGTHTGKHVKRKIEMSQIVPDDLVFNAMRETIQSGICRNGFILDGFPKNVSQAQAVCPNPLSFVLLSYS